jgi:hypothetical protein
MANVSLKFIPAALIAYEHNVLKPQIGGLFITPSFLAYNYLTDKFEQWFEANTADGWVEMRDSWMNVTYGNYGEPSSVDFEFNITSEAVLFKLTFSGAV